MEDPQFYNEGPRQQTSLAQKFAKVTRRGTGVCASELIVHH